MLPLRLIALVFALVLFILAAMIPPMTTRLIAAGLAGLAASMML